MKTTVSVMLLWGIVLLVLACGSEPPPAKQADAGPSDAPIVVPPAQGSYHEMWSALRELETVSQPLATESAKRMLQTLRDQGGSVPADAVSPEPMIINQGGSGEESLWIVVYTDSRLLKPETYAIQQPTRNALSGALYDHRVTGVSFNPFTKVSKHEVFNFNVDKLYLAGLIGYLTAEDAEPGQRCQAANTADEAGKPFEALHHALRALDEREQWSRCELAKLAAMWELDFPGSRGMAEEELEWFIDEGNDTTEAQALLETFRSQAP